MKVAIVHDFFCNLGGSDQVAAALHQLYPDAPVYTLLVGNRNRQEALLAGMDIKTSFVQRLPLARRWHEIYLPLFPLAVESFDLTSFDLVLSSSHACAKGVIPAPEALHICYCHTPARYAWDLSYLYARRVPWLARGYVALVMHRFRVWDVAAASRVDHFVANSRFVAQRIDRYYRRTSTVIHPPVDTAYFTPGGESGDYYLVVSRLTAYKRIDLAVEAFNRLGKPLWIAGDGPERRRLEAMAGPNVRFLGALLREGVRDAMRGCQALIFPGKEDFGITPVEVQATGRPVIAYGQGGAVETVIDGLTGVLFRGQTAEALCEAVDRAAHLPFDRDAIRRHAIQFDREAFCRKMTALIRNKWDERLVDERRRPAADP
ncbi:MAG: glycosyltransferase [Anaerolineae bacterium]|nr:glycosyltransferase [Anaerolineae bacterium]